MDGDGEEKPFTLPLHFDFPLTPYSSNGLFAVNYYDFIFACYLISLSALTHSDSIQFYDKTKSLHQLSIKKRKDYITLVILLFRFTFPLSPFIFNSLDEHWTCDEPHNDQPDRHGNAWIPGS